MAKRIISILLIIFLYSCSKEPEIIIHECFLNEDWFSAYPDTHKVINSYTSTGLTDKFNVYSYLWTGSILPGPNNSKLYTETRIQNCYSSFFKFYVTHDIRCLIDSVVFKGDFKIKDEFGKIRYVRYSHNLSSQGMYFELENPYTNKIEASSYCDTCWKETDPVTISNHKFNQVIKLSNPFTTFGDTFSITTLYFDKVYGLISIRQRNGHIWYLENY